MPVHTDASLADAHRRKFATLDQLVAAGTRNVQLLRGLRNGEPGPLAYVRAFRLHAVSSRVSGCGCMDAKAFEMPLLTQVFRGKLVWKGLSPELLIVDGTCCCLEHQTGLLRASPELSTLVGAVARFGKR